MSTLVKHFKCPGCQGLIHPSRARMGVNNVLDAEGVPYIAFNVSLSCPICDAVLMPLKLYSECPCCGHPNRCGLHIEAGKQLKSEGFDERTSN